ncbi:hypothetical protein TYRP_011489 [Tyrophagus putrescentiae]|nr:hypothetical protein TYRP_011489 [Tyrophagus putrescentiae]
MSKHRQRTHSERASGEKEKLCSAAARHKERCARGSGTADSGDGAHGRGTGSGWAAFSTTLWLEGSTKCRRLLVAEDVRPDCGGCNQLQLRLRSCTTAMASRQATRAPSAGCL